jgi:hypothetical protein
MTLEVSLLRLLYYLYFLGIPVSFFFILVSKRFLKKDWKAVFLYSFYSWVGVYFTILEDWWELNSRPWFINWRIKIHDFFIEKF